MSNYSTKNGTKVSANYLAVADEYFSRIEHYSDRSTVWIKVHLDLLNNYEFCRLPDETKFHFIGLMMLATKMFNRLPNDLEFLKEKLSAKSKINLDLLLEKGFLIACKSLKKKGNFASTETASLEQEKEKEKEEEVKNTDTEPSVSSVSLHTQEIIGEYFSHCENIRNPAKFLVYLKSGKADAEISAWLEARKLKKRRRSLFEKAKEDFLAEVEEEPPPVLVEKPKFPTPGYETAKAFAKAICDAGLANGFRDREIVDAVLQGAANSAVAHWLGTREIIAPTFLGKQINN